MQGTIYASNKYNYTKVVTIDTDRISIIFYTVYVQVYKDVQFMFISNYKNVHATANKMMNKVGT